MSAILQTRGVKAWRLSLFGQDAKNIATLVYGDKTLTSRIAVDNSLFGIYLAGGPTHSRIELLGEKLKGEVPDTSKYGLRQREQQRLATSFLRSCPDCVGEDLEDRGFSAWRVVHQIPFLDHCPHHFRPLSEWRSYATSRPNSLVGLPKSDFQTTAKQGGTRAIEASDGYASYLLFWKLLSNEGMPQLAIDRWSETVSSATARARNVSTLAAIVEDEIRRRWGLSSSAVGQTLGIERSMSVHSELSLNTRPRDLARRLIVLDALNTLRLTPTSDELPSQQDLPFESAPNPVRAHSQAQSIITKLLRIAANKNLRPSLAISLASSREISSALVESGCPTRHDAYAIADGCSTDLLEEIDKTFPANRRNWARQALSRRRSHAARDE